MEISLTGAFEYMDRNVGFGEASYHIYDELVKQGLDVTIRNSESQVGLCFHQPHKYQFGVNQYKIGYTPWESTDVPNNWKKPLTELIDEFWTTNEYCADIFSKHTNKPIFIYSHGIQDTWIPKQRSLDKSRPFRFLHIGEPQYRKDAQMVVDAFISLYGNNPNYELILKCSGMNTTQVKDPVSKQFDGSPSIFYNNIKSIESMLSVDQMNGLYDLCDVFVYPSWGEGFGFNPMQSMAKGIPTISTHVWSNYAKYITAPLDSVMATSPWQDIHPGMMCKPNYNQLKGYMKDIPENYDYYAKIAYKNAFPIHKDFNWEKVSKPAVQRLKEIEKEYF